MGCNIHAYIETKRKRIFWKQNCWKLLEVFPYVKDAEGYGCHFSRNYNLYAYLADVRSYSDKSLAIVPPRGVPEDASKIYRELVRQDGYDGHTNRRLTLDELMQIPWDLKLSEGKPYETTLRKISDEFWNEIIRPMEVVVALGGYDVRVVFHFDN